MPTPFSPSSDPPEEASTPLARALVAARERAGLSQRAAAERLGMAPPQLSKLERGVNAPGSAMLARLATVYGVSVGDLLPAPNATAPTDVVPVEMLAGYWQGRIHEIAAAFALALARLQEFEAAGDRWEVGSAIRSGAVTPATPAAPAAPASTLLPPVPPEVRAEAERELRAHMARRGIGPDGHAKPPAKKSAGGGRKHR